MGFLMKPEINSQHKFLIIEQYQMKINQELVLGYMFLSKYFLIWVLEIILKYNLQKIEEQYFNS